MKKDMVIRLSGWILIVGAVIFAPGLVAMFYWNTGVLRNWDPLLLKIATFAAFWAPLLWAIGILGLRARHANRIGKTVNGVLLFGVILGSIIVIVGNLGQIFAPVYSVSITYYGVWAWGVLLLLICLSIIRLSVRSRIDEGARSS